MIVKLKSKYTANPTRESKPVRRCADSPKNIPEPIIKNDGAPLLLYGKPVYIPEESPPEWLGSLVSIINELADSNQRVFLFILTLREPTVTIRHIAHALKWEHMILTWTGYLIDSVDFRIYVVNRFSEIPYRDIIQSGLTPELYIPPCDYSQINLTGGCNES